MCRNLVHLAPRQTATQQCSSFVLSVTPEPAEFGRRRDFFGNRVDFFSICEAHSALMVTAASEVQLNQSPRQIAEPPSWEAVATQLRSDRKPEVLDAYQFVFASPHVRPSESLAEFARSSLRSNRCIVDAVTDLTARIHEQFTYDPHATTTHTPMDEVLAQRRGVCQDFAHLQIGCLRSLGLAARYVSGYLRTEPPSGRPRLVGADASHAWLSVFCGDMLGWIDFDPTNNLLPSTDHITVAWGRDYSDVCPIQGVVVGGSEHAMSVAVDVIPIAA
jgi:transglutaminase-like putative cysteine protease